MPIVVKSEGSFTPAPAGTHQAVCVDVVDLGMRETQWGHKHKIRIVWQINETMPSGNPYIASATYTASLSDKAMLRADLESWRGRPFTTQELDGFDVETVIGANALLTIVHEEKGGKTWANIRSVSALPKGMARINASEYTRVKDREPSADDAHSVTSRAPVTTLEADDIPF